MITSKGMAFKQHGIAFISIMWKNISILKLHNFFFKSTGILDEDQDDKTILKRQKASVNGWLKREPNHNTLKNGFQKSPKSRYADEKRLALLSEEDEDEL